MVAPSLKTFSAFPRQVLLYDEPTAGLDPIASTVVEDLIRSVHSNGEDALGKPGKIASYVVVTHQHSTIRRAVDRYYSYCQKPLNTRRMLVSSFLLLEQNVFLQVVVSL